MTLTDGNFYAASAVLMTLCGAVVFSRITDAFHKAADRQRLLHQDDHLKDIGLLTSNVMYNTPMPAMFTPVAITQR